MKPFEEGQAVEEKPEDEEVKSELAEEEETARQKEVQFAEEAKKVEYVGNNITKTNACT